MSYSCKWNLAETERRRLMDNLTAGLVSLRGKAQVSQNELANIIGVSRQTYGAVERGYREMSWNTYLALLFFYDNNKKTHQLIRDLGMFPEDELQLLNGGPIDRSIEIDTAFDGDVGKMLEGLDDQAIRAIKMVIMIEYARCKDLSGDVVVKAFDGVTFVRTGDYSSRRAASALGKIKERKRRKV